MAKRPGESPSLADLEILTSTVWGKSTKRHYFMRHAGADIHCTGSMFSGSGRTSPVMWNAAGVSLMGGERTASWVFCRGEPEPMPGADRTNRGRAQASFMHANQTVRRSPGRGHLQGFVATETAAVARYYLSR